MIIQNGILQIVSKTGGGYKDGKPVAAESSLGEPIPCNFKVNNYEKRGIYVDGKFTQAAYIILIEMQEFEPCTFLLKDMRGNTLGTYTAYQKGILFLDAVDNIQITV